ncbi:hypothetical protein AB0F81_43395 [Actinoplanes sp. NPDC024001]|uniref:hypothetical protein n=1 Tax=Actinoplanes sp. NPDC024001 TaxID=3154598 RepID=UPI0034053620
MKRYRILPAALFCTCLAALAACSGTDDEKAAAPAPASPAAVAATTDSAVDDATLCKTMNIAGKTMVTDLTNAQQSEGGVLPADAKKVFTKFHDSATKALASAGDSEVTSASRKLTDEIGKAAASADPIGVAADANFTELNADLTTACQAIGVKVNF